MEQPESNTPKTVRNLVLNQTLGQWVRAVDLVLAHHTPTGSTTEVEANHVTKAALFTMLRRWFDDDTICLLLDTGVLKIPRRIAESSSYDIASVLDRPSDVGLLDDLEPEDHDAPPGSTGHSLTLPPAS
jgi:hypothetical protein